MDTTVMLLPLLAACGIAGLLFAISARRRGLRIKGTDVLIGEAMGHQGVTPADAEAAGFGDEMAVAARRCGTCSAKPECRASLGSILSASLPSSCPNRVFFDCVAAHKARQDEPRERSSAEAFPPWCLSAQHLRGRSGHGGGSPK